MPASRSLEAARRSPPGRREHPPKRDPGAYIGRLPERPAETIPDGVDPGNERAGAIATTQPGPVRGPAPADQVSALPVGHREPTKDPTGTGRA